MRRKSTPVVFLALIALLFLGSPVYGLDMGGMAKSTLKTAGSELAGSLAEYFGVPAAAVTSLFESGLSLDSVVQALLWRVRGGPAVSAVRERFGPDPVEVSSTADLTSGPRTWCRDENGLTWVRISDPKDGVRLFLDP